MNLSKSETIHNLMRAFAGESMAKNRYFYAAQVAEKKKMYFIQNIFELTAQQEGQHGKIFYDFLKKANGREIDISAGYPVGNFDDVSLLLQDAQKHEYMEFNEIYPGFAKVAREEGYEPIAIAFEQIAAIEQQHGDRFSAFADLIADAMLFTAKKKTQWMCLNCGHVHEGTEVPMTCPVCHQPQGYFVPEKYYKFIAAEYTKPFN